MEKAQNQRREQNFFHGAMILTASALLVKLVGALYKIPLQNLIGGLGMSYFNTAYMLFNLLYAVSVAGLPVAVARMVAESSSQGRYRDVRRILTISRRAFLLTGAVGAAAMAALSWLFCWSVNNRDAWICVVALSPAVFFCCILSSYRGYYEGLRNMFPTALSQLVEALVKLTAGLGLSYLITKAGAVQYRDTGRVFGRAVSSVEEAMTAVLPYSAAGAILGVTLSTVASALFLFLRHRIAGDGITRQDLLLSPTPIDRPELKRRLWKIALPVCIGALVLNITSLIDLVSIMNRLNAAVKSGGEVIRGMYEGLLPAGMSDENLPRYLYGIYSAIPLTLFNLIPAITSTFAVSALPNVTIAWTQRDRKGLKRRIDSALRLTSFIVMPAAWGLILLAGPILSLLLAAQPAEAQLGAPLLRVLGIGVFLIGFSMPLSSILQAMGRSELPARYTVMGAIVKLLVNFILVAVPSVNIQAAPYGTLACYLLIFLLNYLAVTKNARIRIDIVGVFLKPLFAGAVCGGTAWLLHRILSKPVGSSLATLLSICLGAVVYAIVLLLTRAVRKEDLFLLPFGEKIAKILAKFRLIR